MNGTYISLSGTRADRIGASTSTFAFFYRLLGGAVICPLWFVAYTLASARKAYFLEGGDVSLSRAKALVAAMVLGCITLTLAMHVPYADIATTQYVTAFWQFVPMVVDLPVFLFSALLPASPPASPNTPAPGSESGDMEHLRRLCRVLFVTAALGHIATTGAMLTSTRPQLGLCHVFLPSRERRMLGYGRAMHWGLPVGPVWHLRLGLRLVPPRGLRPAAPARRARRRGAGAGPGARVRGAPSRGSGVRPGCHAVLGEEKLALLDSRLKGRAKAT
ncbi:hypothetical protein DL765_005571 [Monosporascus sp. GIB2]|nr:hypothetical protein DL765_005571 [Monosporascus sp. GIB2]